MGVGVLVERRPMRRVGTTESEGARSGYAQLGPKQGFDVILFDPKTIGLRYG